MSFKSSSLPDPSLALVLASTALLITMSAPAHAQEIRLGTEFQVNSYTTTYGYQKLPAAGMAANGDFVVVWTSNPQDGSGYGIFGRPFSSAGVALASELQVNTYTTSGQVTPAIAVAPNGDFVVARESAGQDGFDYAIVARRFSSGGVAMAGELQINSYTLGTQRFPSVGIASNGDFVIAWQSYGQDGEDYGAFARRFSSSGAALSDEFQVSDRTIDAQHELSVAGSPDGGFVLVWQDSSRDGSQNGLFGRRYSSLGMALAAEFQINGYTPGTQREAAVAFGADGEFVVAWQSLGQDGSDDGVFARRFSRSGAALAGEFQVHSYTTGPQGYATVAGGAGGSFVVAWSRPLRDQYESVVLAQRFAVPAVLDVDGDGAILPLTDALLMLRYTFGFSGSVLTDGAVNPTGCTRCDADAIEPYLATLK